MIELVVIIVKKHIVDLMVVVLKAVVCVQNIPKVHTIVNFANTAGIL